jgi:ABC-type uncharacterized transport system substrate-binding protein
VELRRAMMQAGCRSAPRQPEQHRGLAEELVNLKVDLLVAEGTPSALAAQRATTKTPIAFFLVADPVASGLVTNLARPGGSLTGLSVAGPGQASTCAVRQIWTRHSPPSSASVLRA